jgi:hypothetical protein
LLGGASAEPRYLFNLHAEIDVTRNRLPHWQQGEAWVFVTWRLGESLPKVKLDQWKEEREVWMKHHSEPWNEPSGTVLDAILCDMNGPAEESLEAVLRQLPVLRQGGLVIFTVKTAGVFSVADSTALFDRLHRTVQSAGMDRWQ